MNKLEQGSAGNICDKIDSNYSIGPLESIP